MWNKRCPDAFYDRLVSLLVMAEGLWLLDALNTSRAHHYFSLWVKATLNSHFHSAIKKPWSVTDSQLHTHCLSARSRMLTAGHRVPRSSDMNVVGWITVQRMVGFTRFIIIIISDDVTRRAQWASYCPWNPWEFVKGLHPAPCNQGLNAKQWAHLCVLPSLPPHLSMHPHTEKKACCMGGPRSFQRTWT